MRVAVDIGGTFTDAVAVDSQGRTRSAKVLTTPERLHDGVLSALEELAVDWKTLESVTNGTTAGLNAFLERRGARVTLLTTKGFRDVYELGRANRPEMYNVRYRPPTPLVQRRHIYEIEERTAADGSQIVAVDASAVQQLAHQIAGQYEAVAICLLHSYANPAHEQQVADLIRSVLPEVSVVCSHEVAPEWREYERTSTTAISAYIAPIVENYLRELEEQTTQRGLRGVLRVMQSNGGVMSASLARRKPIQTLFSGPVGGTIACVSVADNLSEEQELNRLICVDMGGTSFDMSLVIDGKADIELESEIHRHPILAPTVAMHTIGAGGGSIGHISGGGLRVGPQSAGAEPGPACYGAGGTEPTITDANLRLGRLPASARLAGGLALDTTAAETALTGVGETLGLDSVELSAGLIAIADATMANAIREITVRRGIDPRDFSLVAFGGAGPLHAAALADELDISTVIIPVDPGVLSAYGMLQSDSRHDAVQSFYVRVADLTPPALEAALTDLEERARLMIKQDGMDDQTATLEPSADLRYAGQEYTVTLPLDTTAGAGPLLASLPEQFAQAHNERYGHSNPGEAVEFVNLRMAAYGGISRPARQKLASGELPQPQESQPTWFAGTWMPTPVFRRCLLPGGAQLSGPAVVIEEACTTLIPPDWQAQVSTFGHIVITRTDKDHTL